MDPESALVLRDGTAVRIRSIAPEDRDREKRFFTGLSERSRYHRFMQHLHELPPGLLERFIHIDPKREAALVALCEDDIVAVGRYAPDAESRCAEFALVVADALQGKGLGRHLLERLLAGARAAGYPCLYGRVLDDNREMLELATRLGFVREARSGAEVTLVHRFAK
ncbi:MAG: GNAT family N-acetyltransferase [Betaproteobacteria bacterium]